VELRPGYKQTDVGVIPEDWEVKPLGELASVTAGGTPRRTNPRYWNGEIPWITTSEVDFCRIDQAEQFITKDGLLNSAAKLFSSGTLLMALYGQGKTRGKVAILGIEAATNQACAAIALKPGACREFMFHFLASRYDAIRNLSNTGNQENLTSTLVRSIRIVLPPDAEQRAIADALSDVDALLGGLDRLIAKKRDLKQAAMQQLLTGQTRLPGFHGEWRTAKISQLCEYEAGVATAGGEQGYVEIGDIDVVSKSYDVGGMEKPAVRGAVKVPGGTLLISTVRPTRGAIAITREEIYVSSAFCRLRPANGFLFHLVCQARFLAYLGENSFGGTYPTCRDETILSYECLLPSDPEEQRAIATVLSDMDAEIVALEKRRDKTRDLKQAMMQELLTGKMRLVPAGGAHA